MSEVPTPSEDTLAALWREHDVADAIDRDEDDECEGWPEQDGEFFT